MARRETQVRRRKSDVEAMLHLGNYVLERRKYGGNFGIYIRGSRTCVGTIFGSALGLARAFSTLTEVPHKPSEDNAMRALRKQEDSA